MKSILFATALLVFYQTRAQVKTNFNNQERITEKGKFSKNFRGENPVVIPARDIRTLVEKETLENVNSSPRPFKIAEAVGVDIDVVSSAEWVEEGGLAYGKLSVTATSAKSISANFDRFYLPQGTELYVYSQNGEMITGPITEAENNAANFWGSWVYKGEKIIIDLKIPAESKPSLKLHISNVAYGYKDIYKTQVGDFGVSASCEINVICPLGDGWENERNSVALILSGNGAHLFSGTLINNVCNLSTPYLLTANHAFQASTDVGNWKFTFQAWSSTCSPSQNANGVTFNGSTLRANFAATDFCLVELNQVPSVNSGITYAGWSRNTTGIQQTTIIHHPQGDVMKITRDNDSPTVGTFSGVNSWHLIVDNGITEPGSSGAPYFDQNHRIIGQHFGADDTNLPICQQVSKVGGRFDQSWTGGGTNATRLSNWLDPGNTGAMTVNTRGIFSVSGPSTICTTGAFSMNNLPQGETVTWSSSNPSGLSIDATTGEATRQGNYAGLVTITANISGGFCGPVNLTQLVVVGSPAPSVTYVEVTPIPDKPSRYDFTATPIPEATYQWFVNNTLQSNYTGNIFRTYIPCGITKTIKCRINNPCGTSAFSGDISITGECLLLSSSTPVYPNPVSSELIVSLDSCNAPSDIMLVNSYQEAVYATKTQELTIKIPVDKLPEGVYYLSIINKEGILQKRVLIAHTETDR